ncbi:MAG: hypothetical protein V1777_04110 [Candidatus Micrarchaeota archaeon]
MYKPPYEIRFTHHALKQADKRNIGIEIIEDTVEHGQFNWFGKNRVKIVKHYHNRTIVCMDEKVGNVIRIVTITKKEWL